MKIAFLIYDLHFGGGGERVVTNLANELVKKKYQVTILSLCKRKNREYTFPIDERVHIEYINTDIFKISIMNKLVSIFKLKTFFKRETFDIVLGIGTYLNVLLALCINKSKSYKTIGCEHNYFFSVSYTWSVLRKWFYPKLSAVVSLTEEDIKHLSLLNKTSMIIPNSSSFSISDKASLENNKIISLGRFNKQKGYDLMLSMFFDFCKVNDKYILEIYGEGPVKRNIEQLIKQYNLEDRVRIFSATTQIIPVYMGASIYLMTSRYEGLPMVLIEASECGLPLVAYDCKTGPSEIICNGQNGFLIPCFEKSKMVEKLNLLCNDVELRKKMGEKSKELAYRFDKEVIVDKWITLFNQIL